ncbi:MAG TPA: complex I NDUFA9 subunit family protein [Albitalea sp.]|nr:complex I NDUFA9 subunit family protein [Albitalea sp.]
MNNILVLGGSGFLGRSVCEKLVERMGGADERLVVATRHLNRSGDLLTLPTLELEQCNVHDDADLRRVVHGRDVVINLVGILHGSEAEFQRVHVELPRRLAQVCAAAGVQRLLHVSALGADAQAPSRYLRSKAAGEAALRHPGVASTVFRPSVMFGAGDHFINRFASLQRVLPVVPLACAQARFQPVWVEDVAHAIANSLDSLDAIGETFECTGPTVYTLRELVHLAGRWSGHERPVVALPGALARAQALLLEAMPGQPLMSRDNLDSMKVPNVATGKHPGIERFGITPRALDTVMPDLLAHRRGPDRLLPKRVEAHHH